MRITGGAGRGVRRRTRRGWGHRTHAPRPVVGAAVAGALAVALAFAGCKRSAPSPTYGDDARAERLTPGATIATPGGGVPGVPVGAAGAAGVTGAAAEASVLVGDERAVDAQGYPTAYVDAAVLRGMLARREYGALTRVFEKLQGAFEADPKREVWPMDAADAFDQDPPEVVPLLDGWVAAAPDSFAPYLARGSYYRTLARMERGGRYAVDTPGNDFGAMHATNAKARPDLDRALALRPKLVAAHRARIQLESTESGGAALRRARDAALRACPSCFQVRVTYLLNTTPRWGGSYEAMEAFAKASAGTSPRAGLLPGYLEVDRAEVLGLRGAHQDALARLERANALGEHWEFLFHRAYTLYEMKQYDRAVLGFDRALELRPDRSHVLASRASALLALGRFEAAARDLRRCLLLAPTQALAKDRLPHVVKGLAYEAQEHGKAGRRAEALRLLGLATELAPHDADLQRRYAWTVLGDAGAPDAIASLEADVAANPDDFAKLQQLDYALAKAGRFARVVELWTAYLARHPDAGRAYLERGGAYYNLRKLAEAKADATKACSLGVSEGCAQAKRLP